MSNNIYDILKKINKLENNVQTLKESKSMDKKKEDKKDESKKKDKADKGAIAEAVARVEKQLSEKYHGFKKIQESEVEESGLQAYLGKKKYGETGMKALQKAGREGASKEKMAMIRAKHDKMDEAVDQEGPADLLAAVEQEINNPGRTVDNLTDVLNATFGSDRSPEFKKARAVIGKYIDLVDNAAMGSEQDGIAPMRGGNIARHIQQYDLTDYLQHAAAMLDKAVKGPMDKGNYNEEMLSPKQKKFASLAEPKDKITYADKIAGAKKGTKNEGPEILKIKADQAKAQGKDSFKVGDKTFPVKEGFPTVSDAEKRMREKEGKTSHGKKTTTSSGVKHERDYDAVEKGADVDTRPKGRGRPKKDRFA
jgi:hypothetical protein